MQQNSTTLIYDLNTLKDAIQNSSVASLKNRTLFLSLTKKNIVLSLLTFCLTDGPAEIAVEPKSECQERVWKAGV